MIRKKPCDVRPEADYRPGSAAERNHVRMLITHLKAQGCQSISDAPQDAQDAWRKLLGVLPNGLMNAQEARLKPKPSAAAHPSASQPQSGS